MYSPRILCKNLSFTIDVLFILHFLCCGSNQNLEASSERCLAEIGICQKGVYVITLSQKISTKTSKLTFVKFTDTQPAVLLKTE